MPDIYDHIATLLKGYEVSRVLDVGAGTGTLGLYLREYGFCGVYRGFDKDPKACQAMELHGFQVEEGDLKWLDYHKYTWDAVVMQDVIEHLENISLLMNAIAIAKRYFVLTTEINIIDSITPLPFDTRYFHIDDLISIAAACSFHLKDYQRVGNHSVLIYKRRLKRASRSPYYR